MSAVPQTGDRASPLATATFAGLLVVAGVFLMHQTRGNTLLSDEWRWAVERLDNDVGTFLTPHNDHLSLVPVAIYKVLFATVGIGNYVPYRLLVTAGHLGCVALLFAYASRRVGGWLALLAAALMLFLGPGWQNMLWPFQIAWLISIGAGIGALLLLDRDNRAGDVAASALIAVSLASSGIGVPIALGMIVEVLWARRRPRDIWIVLAPLALYAVWWVGYQEVHSTLGETITAWPGWSAALAAGTLSSLTGLFGQTVPGRGGGTLIEWGAPLVVGAVALLAWRIARLGRFPPRALTLLTVLMSFWILTALDRAAFAPPYESRYLYVSALFVVLVAVELARGVSLAPRVRWLLTLAVAAAVLSNIGGLRAAAAYQRGQSRLVTADLGALQLARPLVHRGVLATGFPGYPLFQLDAGAYLEAEKVLGAPAATAEADIAAKPERARLTADVQLLQVQQMTLRPAARRPQDREACVTGRDELSVPVPWAGLWVAAHGSPATLAIRRFADGYQRLGALAAAAPATLRLQRDLAARPWQLRVVAPDGATVCRLR
ncbi:MAG: hypothetical protein QOK00_3357 [Thermoleophilaceae bacterium]|nr:hypothetical protein [Thermoleophilaceae bacterium]